MYPDKNTSIFESIYHTHWKSLYLSVYKVLQDKAQAEDIVQEVFSSIWNNQKFLTIDPIGPYLYQAARFQVFKTFRDQKIKAKVWKELDIVLYEETTFGQIEANELDAQIQKNIASLPEKCREIFRLRRENELSIKEIAIQLGLSPKTVEGQLTIAMKKLRSSLAQLLTLSLILLLHFISEK